MAVFKQDRQDRDYYALQELLKPKEEAEKSSGIGTKPDNQEQDDEGLFSGFFGGLFDRSRQQAQELSVLAEEEAIRSALEIRLMRQAAGITSSKAPTGPLSDTARDAIFSSSDMRGTELTMKDNAREAQEVFQPTITPVSRGEQPEKADSPAPVDAPSVDTRSNEMLDKAIQDVLETVLDSDVSDSTDSADGGAAPSDGKDFEFEPTSKRLVEDLKRDFDLTTMQASAIVGNLATETDNFNTLQEYKPVVEGSRGGYGFAQWTGPRRKRYEAWTKENELDPSTYEANYGYLKYELSNTDPEIGNMGKNTIKRLKKATNLNEATATVMNGYLKPGIPHLDKRQNSAAFILGLFN